MKSSDASFTADGLQMLNAVCDEFRRQMKAGLLESGVKAPVNPADVLHAAEALQQSRWLTKFQNGD